MDTDAMRSITVEELCKLKFKISQTGKVTCTLVDDSNQKKNILFLVKYFFDMCFPGGSVVMNLLAKARDTGDVGLIPGPRRFPGVGNGNPLQYS